MPSPLFPRKRTDFAAPECLHRSICDIMRYPRLYNYRRLIIEEMFRLSLGINGTASVPPVGERSENKSAFAAC